MVEYVFCYIVDLKKIHTLVSYRNSCIPRIWHDAFITTSPSFAKVQRRRHIINTWHDTSWLVYTGSDGETIMHSSAQRSYKSLQHMWWNTDSISVLSYDIDGVLISVLSTQNRWMNPGVNTHAMGFKGVAQRLYTGHGKYYS